MTERAVILGAAGFIGRNLAYRLSTTGTGLHLVTKPGGQPPPSFSGTTSALVDILDVDGMTRTLEGAELVFHLAGINSVPRSLTDPHAVFHCNANGTLAVLEASRRARIKRLVLCSTSAVYGRPRQQPITEDHPLEALTPYAASKIAAEKLAEAYRHLHGLAITVVRPFNVYGPDQPAEAIIPSLIDQAVKSKILRIGNNSRRDFVHVDDVVTGLIVAARSPEALGRTINLGSGVATAISKVARKIIGIAGSGSLRIEGDRRRPGSVDVE